jgi:hypothetical protein
LTHITRAQLDGDVNKNLFDEIWENIIKMGKTARLIGRINVQGLIGENGELSKRRMIDTKGQFQSHISGKTIEWTSDDDKEWINGVKLELTEDLKVIKLRHKYKACGAGTAKITHVGGTSAADGD